MAPNYRPQAPDACIVLSEAQYSANKVAKKFVKFAVAVTEASDILI